MRTKLHVFINNHFDPTWRRCWKQPLVFNGKTFVSYADLQEFYMLDNLEIAREHEGYTFMAESTIVAREFLRRHPERLEELKQLYNAGRFSVNGAGDNIIDVNLVMGESIVRNYLYGFRWVEETFGHGTPFITRKDGFGNSAQLPQIVRGLGIKWLWPIYYSAVKGDYWRGLDGSTVFVGNIPHQGMEASPKYKPCASCSGSGCDACRHRAIEAEVALLPSEELGDEEIRRRLKEKVDGVNAIGLLRAAEEMLPNPKLPDWAESMRDEFDVEFSLWEDMAQYLQDKLEAVDNPPEEALHPAVEFNPNNTGVYVTRIKTKQNVRRQEMALYNAETLAVMAAMQGAAYPHRKLAAVWEDLLFTMFHDAVTGTMVDAAYDELTEYWPRIDAATVDLRENALNHLSEAADDVVTVINPRDCASPQIVTIGNASFVADVPPFTAREYPVPVAAETKLDQTPRIENERFVVEADEHGLKTIFDKKLNRAIAETAEYRPGELMLEHDEGSPWATVRGVDLTRNGLAEKTTFLHAERGDGFERLVFEVDHKTPFHGSATCRGSIAVTLFKGIERVGFRASLWWSAFNKRLRVAMPVPMKGRHLYEIPGGVLEREPYEPWYFWQGSAGDWPAINWAGIEAENGSVALFNKGLPCYKIEEGEGGSLMLLTILRAPALPTYLHAPHAYTMTDYDGMRDEGDHEFEFALTAYADPFEQSSVVADAEGYNAGLIAAAGRVSVPELPRVSSGAVRISCMKWAEDAAALILRLTNCSGAGQRMEVEIPSCFGGAALVNLMEEELERLTIVEGRITHMTRPWEIFSVKLLRDEGATG